MITIHRIYFSLAIGLNMSRHAAKNWSMSEDAFLGIALTESDDQEVMFSINANRNDYRLIYRLLILGKQNIFYCGQKRAFTPVFIVSIAFPEC